MTDADRGPARRPKAPWPFVAVALAFAGFALFVLGIAIEAAWSGEVRTLASRNASSRLVSVLREPDRFWVTVAIYASLGLVAAIGGGLTWRAQGVRPSGGPLGARAASRRLPPLPKLASISPQPAIAPRTRIHDHQRRREGDAVLMAAADPAGNWPGST
jgi:hypothetical protein